MDQHNQSGTEDTRQESCHPDQRNSPLMMDVKPTEQVTKQYYEIRYDRWPEADAELAWVYESMRPEIVRLANEERSRIQTIGDPKQRLETLKARRSSLVFSTTVSKMRDHRATQYLVAGMATFGIIPAMALLPPNTAVIPNQIEQWITIAALAVTFTCSLRCLLLVFEPWLSGRLARPTPGIQDAPRTTVVVQSRHRFAWGRVAGVPAPRLERFYRCLPVTQIDLRSAAVEVVQAEELARQERRTT